MVSRILIATGTAVLLGVCGGGPLHAEDKPTTYERYEKMIQNLEKALVELAVAFEEIKDAKTAETSATKIIATCDRLEQLGKKSEDLPRLGLKDSKKLEKKYMPAIKDAAKRLAKAVPEAAKNSAGQADYLKAVRRMKEVGKYLEKIGKKLQAR